VCVCVCVCVCVRECVCVCNAYRLLALAPCLGVCLARGGVAHDDDACTRTRFHLSRTGQRVGADGSRGLLFVESQALHGHHGAAVGGHRTGRAALAALQHLGRSLKPAALPLQGCCALLCPHPRTHPCHHDTEPLCYLNCSGVTCSRYRPILSVLGAYMVSVVSGAHREAEAYRRAVSQ